MKTTLLVTLISLTFAMSSLYATQTLSFSGPGMWTPGTSITLSVQDTYSGFGAGSYGLSYWLEVNNSGVPFLTITGLSYFTFTAGNYNGPFPVLFNIGTIDAFWREPADLGSTSQTLVPDGSYHVTDITFALAGNAPVGTYTLRTTTASPFGSIQVTSDFGDAPFPQASFIFTVVPEPSTLALVGLTALSAGVVAYRRRK